MKKQRIEYFDAAKGIAIIAVIVGHMGLIARGMTLTERFIFSFHMPIFFLISGYFLSSRMTLWEFAKKRFKQLIFPYIFTWGIMCAWSVCEDFVMKRPDLIANLKMWILAGMFGAGSDHNDVMSRYQIHQIGAIWFLLALFVALLITRFFIQYRYGYIGILVIAIIGYYSSKYIWFPWSIQPGMVACIFVYLGWLCKSKKLLSIRCKKEIFVLLCAVWYISIIFSRGLYMVNNAYENGILDIAGALAGSYVIIIICMFLCKYCSGIKKILLFYGKNSLIVLCFHLVELNMFPWGMVYGYIISHGMSDAEYFVIQIVGKMLWVTAGIMIVRRFALTRKIFCIES